MSKFIEITDENNIRIMVNINSINYVSEFDKTRTFVSLHDDGFITNENYDSFFNRLTEITVVEEI